jgi:hypothetical protein
MILVAEVSTLWKTQATPLHSFPMQSAAYRLPRQFERVADQGPRIFKRKIIGVMIGKRSGTLAGTKALGVL